MKKKKKSEITDKHRLKIAMLGHKTVPVNFSRDSGGIEVVVEELAKRQVQLGCDVTCYNRVIHYTNGKRLEGDKLEEYEGIKLKSVFTIDRKGLAAATSSFFASLKAAVGDYDVVHIHAEGPSVFCWIPKLFGKRVICHNHGIDWKRDKWKDGFASKYIKFGEWCSAKFADEIIVLSEGIQKYFLETYGRKTVLIPNGVNRPEIRKADEIARRWRLERDSYILFLGRLVPEKGLKYLVEAYSKLNTDKKLVIAGGSSDTDDFVKELKESCKAFQEHVIFTGFVQGKVLDELYSNAFLYVLPSDLEGMPLSLLEAMSYGNCCVVSDIDECTAVVEDRGSNIRKAVIFEKGNTEDLRKTLQVLCDDENLVQRYKAEAADFICNKYNWDDVVEQVMAVYRGAEVDFLRGKIDGNHVRNRG